jgi:uncharacterized protein YuzE
MGNPQRATSRAGSSPRAAGGYHAVGALYLRLDDSPTVESEEVSSGLILDFDAHRHVVGVEILQLSQRPPHLDINEMQVQTI